MDMKAQGVRAGIPDVHLPVSNGIYASLYIEMKHISRITHKNGGLEPNQVKWKAKLESANNLVLVCYDWIEACNAFVEYLK